mgnify:FL=1
MPKLSLIIPAYNAEQYIKPCLDSILQNSKESLSKTEIIVINDGSTDNTLKILESYNQYKNIKIHTTKNQGVSAARNLGISLAKGEWITFIDADDTVNTNFSKVVNLVENSKSSFIIFGNYDIETIDKKILTTQTLQSSMYLSGPWSKVYNRQFLIKYKILFEKDILMGEDMLFNLEVIQNSDAIESYKIGFYNYRQNNNSVTRRFNQKIIESDKKFYKKLEKILINQHDPKEDMVQLIQNEKSRAVLSLLTRISYSKNIDEAISFYKKIDIDYYNPHPSMFSGVKKIVVYLFLKKRYNLIYIFMNLRLSLGRIRNTKERFIEI